MTVRYAQEIPEVSADRGDADVTLVVTEVPIQLFATTLTANRTITLPTADNYNGAWFKIVRTGLGAFTLDVGGLYTIPASETAWVDVRHNGTSWQLHSVGRVSDVGALEAHEHDHIVPLANNSFGPDDTITDYPLGASTFLSDIDQDPQFGWEIGPVSVFTVHDNQAVTPAHTGYQVALNTYAGELKYRNWAAGDVAWSSWYGINDWDSITNKPGTFPSMPDWDDVQSKPSTFPPEAHEHDHIANLEADSTLYTDPPSSYPLGFSVMPVVDDSAPGTMGWDWGAGSIETTRWSVDSVDHCFQILKNDTGVMYYRWWQTYGSNWAEPIFIPITWGGLPGKPSTFPPEAHAASHKGDGSDPIANATTSVSGLHSDTDKTKLDGIESGATADQTAAEILTAIKTVDGSGSGLDADTLDGHDTSYFAASSDTRIPTQDENDALVGTNGTPSTSNKYVTNSDSRNTDTRTPSDDSVTNAKVSATAAIAESKLNLASDAAAGTASRRTLGTGAQQAVAGNDSRLSDSRTPTAHKTTHEPGGSDAMTVDAAAATGSLRTLGTGATQATAGNDSRLSDSRTPTSHATSHVTGGSDVIPNAVAGGNSGLFRGTDQSKLDTIEAGATADMTAAEILTAVKTVDGTGSGLDADTLDGSDSSVFATAANLTAHIDDVSDAHDASAISYAGGTGMSATDLEAAVDELASEKSDVGHTHVGAAFTLIETEVNLGSSARMGGEFNITSSGLTTGKHVLVQQLNGPYTGKGTLADEAEMDALTVSGRVTDATTIQCFWKSATRVRGNFKFGYTVSA